MYRDIVSLLLIMFNYHPSSLSPRRKIYNYNNGVILQKTGFFRNMSFAQDPSIVVDGGLLNNQKRQNQFRDLLEITRWTWIRATNINDRGHHTVYYESGSNSFFQHPTGFMQFGWRMPASADQYAISFPFQKGITFNYVDYITNLK